MSLSDADLVTRLPHDSQALAELYGRHVDAVRRFAARRCMSADDVADVVSDTFLALLDSAPRYNRRRGDVLPWLFGIELRVLARQRRLAAHQQRIEHRAAGRRLLDEDDYARIEAEIDAERLAPRLERELARAPRGERELFLLVSRDGLSVAGAGRALGISPLAARARLVRVRRRLRATTDLNESDAGLRPRPSLGETP
jgi:RNA polymerase sigma-70 factor, ECF subfamily